MAIVDLTYVKSVLQISGSSLDSWITGVGIPSVEAAIQSRCKRPFGTSVSVTEFYTGTGTSILVLRAPNVTAVANVWEDHDAMFGDAHAHETLLTLGKDYAVEKLSAGNSPSGRLVRQSGLWEKQRTFREANVVAAQVGSIYGNYKVQYTYSSVPEDLKYAAASLVKELLRVTASRGGSAVFPVVREKLGRYEYEMGLAASLMNRVGSIQEILARHTMLPVA